MPRTIKVSGFSDELLALVERRWPRHYGDRSEYIRDLIRKDVLQERKRESISTHAVVREAMSDVVPPPAAPVARPKRTPRKRPFPMLG